jgi:hypothetical protein
MTEYRHLTTFLFLPIHVLTAAVNGAIFAKTGSLIHLIETAQLKVPA